MNPVEGPGVHSFSTVGVKGLHVAVTVAMLLGVPRWYYYVVHACTARNRAIALSVYLFVDTKMGDVSESETLAAFSCNV